MSRIDRIVAELQAEREAFHAGLHAVDVELVTVPGVVEDWSVRDLVVHVAFWAEHATEALRLVAEGRGADFDYDRARTDAMNAQLLDESRLMTPNVALQREDGAFAALAAAIAGLDPDLLDRRLGNGDTVAEVIAYDGAAHYREHTAHLRGWFGDAEAEDLDEG